MFQFIITKAFYSIQSNHSIIFFGTGKIAYPILKTISQKYKNLSIVTQTSGKKQVNQVRSFCQNNAISWGSPIGKLQTRESKKKNWDVYLQNMGSPDLGIVCSYGNMLPSRIIDKFKYGVIVVHPSLLPKYRGGAPIFHAVANGDQISGISYIQTSKGQFDNGQLLYQIPCKIGLETTFDEVQTKLANQAANHIHYVLDNLHTLRPGKNQKDLEKQIPPHLILAPIIKTKKLDLNMKAEKVYHWSRALQTPKVFFKAKQKQLIIRLGYEFLDGEGKVGTFKIQGKKLFLRCQDRYVKMVGWYQPTKKQLAHGIFIAQFLKSGKYPLQDVQFN